MDHILLLALLSTLLTALCIMPGQATGDEYETTDAWASTEVSA